MALKIIIGNALSRSFVWRVKDSDPVEYINLTSKVLRLFIKAGSRTLFQMTTDDSPTANGSSITIDDAANGEFSYRITDEETAAFRRSSSARLVIEYEEPSGDIKPLYTWTATIERS